MTSILVAASRRALCHSFRQRFVPSLCFPQTRHVHDLLCGGCGITFKSDPSALQSHKPSTYHRGGLKQQSIFEQSLANLDAHLRSEIVQKSDVVLSKQQTSTSAPAPVLCERCHSLKHHNRLPESPHNHQMVGDSRQIENSSDLLVNVIDVMDFPMSLVMDGRTVPNRMLYVFNRVDILCKNYLQAKSMRPKLASLLYDHGVRGNPAILIVSALKGWGVDELAQHLQRRRRGTNVRFVGSANAGKSSLVSALLRRAPERHQTPLTSHVPGTTQRPMSFQTSLLGSGRGPSTQTILDFPGVLSEGFSHVIKESQLRSVLPHQHINTEPVALQKGRSMLIGDLARIDYVEGSADHVSLRCFVHANVHLTSQPEYILSKPMKYRLEACPPFEEAFEKTFAAREGAVDILLKDLGFLSLIVRYGSAVIRVSTPGGKHAGVRRISLS